MSESTIKLTVPILAVDEVQINYKTAGKMRIPSSMGFMPMPKADLKFIVNDGEEKKVVAAVRLDNKQLFDLAELLENAKAEYDRKNFS